MIEAAVRWACGASHADAEDLSDALQDAVTALHAGADGSCPNYDARLDPCPPGCASGVCVANVEPPGDSCRCPSMDCEHSRVWTPATFGDLWPGDRVRIGTQEADVTRVNRGLWHTRNRVWIDDTGRERDHQTPWEHEELNIDLTANPGLHDYDPAIKCEILADADRRAALIIQRAFPGTEKR